MKWCGVLVVLISVTSISISLGCIDRKDISEVNNVIESSNNNFKAIVKMMPNYEQGEIFYFDFKAVREDENLKPILKSYRGPWGFEMIDANNTDYGASTFGADMYGGSFDMNQVIKRLNDKPKRINYLGMDYWVGSNNEIAPMLVINDKLIRARDFDDTVLKAWIEVSRGKNKSLYEGNGDVRDVAERLPSGVIILIGNHYWFNDIVKMGMAVSKEDKTTLKVRGIYKFNNETSAAKLKDLIMYNPSPIWNMTVVDTKLDGKYIEINAKMPIKEWISPTQPQPKSLPIPTSQPVIINNTEFRKNRLKGLKFYENIELAQEVARKENKFVFVFFTFEGDNIGEKFEERVLTDPQIVMKLNEKFISVYVDINKQIEMAKKFNIIGTPTSIILNSNGEKITGIGAFDKEMFFLTINETTK